MVLSKTRKAWAAVNTWIKRDGLYQADCYREDPRPLIHSQYKFMLVFSAKSACTSSVIWFFNSMGLYSEARNYHQWPHKYRSEVFYNRPEVLGTLDIPIGDLKVVRVVRDPIERAASSFRHALGTAYTDDAINKATGVCVANDGLSFRQFIDFLESEDLRACDIHHRFQQHPVEDLKTPDFLINVSKQDLFQELNLFEHYLGIEQTDFSELEWIHSLQAGRSPETSDVTAPADRVVLTRQQARKGPWPTHLISPEARTRLRALYRVDVEAYGELGAPL